MRSLSVLLLVLTLFSCRQSKKDQAVKDSRTTGETTVMVDESFSNILDVQIEVFVSDYPDAKVNTVSGNEAKILPALMEKQRGMLVLSRMLNASEERYFKAKQIQVFTDRFAIDGIALITNAANTDTLISAKEILDIIKGESSSRKLVFDNAASSTVRYFLDSAKVSTLPKSGVYTLSTNNDVIKYVGANRDYVGIVGINWLIANKEEMQSELTKVKIMSVKNLEGKKGGDSYYKPTQNNLISGVYPFLRNIYVINCEGTNGLGTGFANWLNSPRGQLIVLKSGLGPHKMISRDFNLK